VFSIQNVCSKPVKVFVKKFVGDIYIKLVTLMVTLNIGTLQKKITKK
jgi:hypothetical protein